MIDRVAVLEDRGVEVSAAEGAVVEVALVAALLRVEAGRGQLIVELLVDKVLDVFFEIVVRGPVGQITRRTGVRDDLLRLDVPLRRRLRGTTSAQTT